MKSMKKLLALILAVIMIIGSLSACTPGSTPAAPDAGKEQEQGEKEDTPAVDVDTSKYPGLTEKETEALSLGLINLDGTMPVVPDPDAFEAKYGRIKMFVHKTGSRIRPVTELALVKEWEDLTGIRFDWTDIPYEGTKEKINLILSAGGDDLPDCFYNFLDGQSGAFVTNYIDQDIFIPTEDLIDNYMPHYKAAFESKEEYRKGATAPDGHIYGFPYIEEMYGLVLTPGPFEINADWLEKCGLEMPTTVDEYVAALKAFRDYGDLNGNGVADEYPMALTFGAHDTFGSNDIFYRFTGCFGQADSYCEGNYLADHLYVDNGTIKFSATDDAFRKTAEFFHDLYDEGLIWDGSFEADASMAFENTLLKQDVATVGSFSTWGGKASITNLDVRNQYDSLPRLTGEAGKTGFRLNYSEMQDTSNTAITVNCEFPHLIALWLDAIAADPALSVTSNWGAVGAVFEKQDDGFLLKPRDENGNTYALGEFGKGGESEGQSAREETTPCRGSFIIKDEYFEIASYDAPTLIEGQRKNGKEEILEDYADSYLPKMMTTTDEANRLAQIYPTISDIVDRYEATWVLNGVTDESWEAYKAEIQNAGVEDYINIWQGIYDRNYK